MLVTTPQVILVYYYFVVFLTEPKSQEKTCAAVLSPRRAQPPVWTAPSRQGASCAIEKITTCLHLLFLVLACTRVFELDPRTRRSKGSNERQNRLYVCSSAAPAAVLMPPGHPCCVRTYIEMGGGSKQRRRCWCALPAQTWLSPGRTGHPGVRRAPDSYYRG